MRIKNDPVDDTPEFNKGPSHIQKEKGFTLVEIMITIAIFSIGFLAVGSMQISAINANAKSRMRTEATALATAKIEEFLNTDYADLENAGSEIQGPYTISWSFNENVAATLKTTEVTVSWVSRGRTRSVNLNYRAPNMELRASPSG
jgi:prepilin-type N-terminal cleavage/methylation domain-containing protein